jgi:hypothetical protein
MRIKMTHSIKDYQAGRIYEVPFDEAQDLIGRDMAFEYLESTIDVTTMSDKTPHFIENVKPKRKVNYGDR